VRFGRAVLGMASAYLFIRIPLQLILIIWTYWFAVRKATTKASVT